MNWHYKNDDQVVGPLSEEAITELHACGVLTSATLVRREGTEEWLPFGKAFEKGAAQPAILIKFYCHKCQQKISAESTAAGTTSQCPSCDAEFVVPNKLADAEDEEVVTTVADVDFESTNEADAATHHPEPAHNHETCPSLADRLREGAKQGWSGVKRHSKQAALRAQAEKLRNVDLRRAHHSLGKKCFDLGLLEDALAEHFQVVRDLDARIAEKREAEEVRAGETKMDAMKRIGKHTAKASHAQALTLKREHLITELGRQAHARVPGANVDGLQNELHSIADIEGRIQCKDEEAHKLGDGAKGRIPTMAVASALVVLLVVGAFVGLKMLGHKGGTDAVAGQETLSADRDDKASLFLTTNSPASSRSAETNQSAKNYPDLHKWRIAGVHLGMSKEQVVKALTNSLGSGLFLEKAKTSNNDLSTYVPQLETKDGLLKTGLARSRFSFDNNSKLRKISVDLEVVKVISDLEELGTKPLAQQLLRQFDIEELRTNQLPGYPSSVTYLVHEAVIPNGEDYILVAIVEFDEGGYKSRQIEIRQVKPLSFGPVGTIFGLKFGMTNDQVISILRVNFGNDTKLAESTNGKNRDLPKSLTAFDIISKKDTLGTGNRGFVVFDKGGKLCEIFLNSDQLREVSSCAEYAPSSFAQFFMAHFNLREMAVEKKIGVSGSALPGALYQIEYEHSDVDYIHMFSLEEYNGYSVYLIHKKNRVNF